MFIRPQLRMSEFFIVTALSFNWPSLGRKTCDKVINPDGWSCN